MTIFDFIKNMETKSEKTFPNFNPADLRIYITHKYVGLLTAAKIAANPEVSHKTRIEFMAFAHGTPFQHDVARLCNAIEKGQYNTELINAYLDKITAIHAQDYEKAAQMRDKIASLTPLDNRA